MLRRSPDVRPVRLALPVAVALVASVLPVSAASGAPPECQDTFTGSGTWSGPGWSNGTPPKPAEVACLATGAELTLSSGEEPTLAGLSISGGTFILNGTLTAPTTLTGGLLSGTGTIKGQLTNTGGTVAPGAPLGTLKVEGGDYVQGEGGTLRIYVEGKEALQYSVLDVEGQVSLGGTLTLMPTAGYLSTAAAGDMLRVITHTEAISNGFSTTQASPPLERGLGVTAETLFPEETIEAMIVAPGQPEADLPPVVTGGTFVGETLSAANGSWFNYVEDRSLQWERCSISGSGCTEIGGATGQTYTTRPIDAGHTIRVVESVSNQSGVGGPSASAPTAVIQNIPVPVNTSAPRITGHPEIGSTLSCSPGGWTRASTGFAYEWTRDGLAIDGAVSSSYVVTSEDEKHAIGCVVRGINQSGAGLPAKSTTVTIAMAAPLALRCSSRPIELTRVLLSGHSVYLGGVALGSFAGRRVTISLSGIPRRFAAGRGGTTTVSANGSFALKLPRPGGPQALAALYTAKVAGHASPPQKLGRELLLVGERAAAGGTLVTFKGSGPLGKGTHLITIVRQTGCTTSEVVLRKPMVRGVIKILLPAPATGAGATFYYRAQTPVGHRLSSSLPIAVK